MKILKKANNNTSDYNYKEDIAKRRINYFLPYIPFSIFKIYEILFCNYYSFKVRFTTFTFKNKKYKYFDHIYNHTWKNERRVEVPIIWDIIKDKESTKILEVGNVLSHYFPIKHDVVDKYEKGTSVINEDIVTFKPKKKYDYIVSISTLEHVGWDEAKKDKTKIIQAVKNLKEMLTPKGKIIFIIPLGYNPYMDNIIFQNKLNLDEQYFLKRISSDNLWKELKLDKSEQIFYHNPFPNGNGIIVGIINNG